VLVGILPALRATSLPALEAIRDGGRGVAGGRRRSRVQMCLVVSQVALVFVLLTVTGLLIRSLDELTRVDMGFDADHVLTVSASVPAASVDAATSDDQARAFFRGLTGQLSAIPGVRSVGGAVQMPTFGWSAPPATIESPTGPVRDNVHSTSVTPSFFATMSIRTVAGRTFTEDDRAGTEPVAVVSQGFVRRFWPGENPLGKRVKMEVPMWRDGPEPRWLTVVGVVADVRFSPTNDPMPTVYQAHAQVPSRSLILVLKTDAGTARIAPAAMAAVRAANRNIVVRAFTLSDRIREGRTMVGRRFATLLLSMLAAVATLMALLGIYAVLAYSVAQRTHEIGIRMALGASRAAVVGQVSTLAMGMAGLGVAIGLPCSLAASRTLRTFLFGVSPTDPATLAAVAVMVMIAAAAASVLPARRAVTIDPVRALRSE
jgi:predicted permease